MRSFVWWRTTISIWSWYIKSIICSVWFSNASCIFLSGFAFLALVSTKSDNWVPKPGMDGSILCRRCKRGADGWKNLFPSTSCGGNFSNHVIQAFSPWVISTFEKFYWIYSWLYFLPSYSISSSIAICKSGMRGHPIGVLMPSSDKLLFATQNFFNWFFIIDLYWISPS